VPEASEGAARAVPSAATKLALVDALAAWLVAVLGGGKLTSACRPPPRCGRMVRVASWAWAMAWTMDSPRPSSSPWPARSEPLEGPQQPVDGGGRDDGPGVDD
jgi:hypothetical protein